MGLGTQLHNTQLFHDLADTSGRASNSVFASSSSASCLKQQDSIIQNKNLDTLLNSLWERDTESPAIRDIHRQSKKRKASASDVDSTEMDTEPSTSGGNSGGPGGNVEASSRLSQKNALLAQLLSKKAAKETVVNTHLTVNPVGVPQQRIPRNLNEKLVTIKGGGRSTSVDKATEAGGVASMMSTGTVSGTSKMANPHDNPRTNPNTPFPGNTSAGGMGGGMGDGPRGFSSAYGNSLGSGVTSMDLSEDNVTSQLEQFQHFFSDSMGPMATDSASSDSTDPLLQQILQQAADLEEDLSSGNYSAPDMGSVAPPVSTQPLSAPQPPLPTSLPTPLPAPVPTPLPAQQHQPSLSQQHQLAMHQQSLPPHQHQPQQHQFPQSMMESSDMSQEEQNMLAQLEQLISDGSLQGVDSLLGIAGLTNTSGVGSVGGGMDSQTAGLSSSVGIGDGVPGVLTTSLNEQMAIDEIQRQLMNDDPLSSSGAPGMGPMVLQNAGGAGMYSPGPAMSPMMMGSRGAVAAAGATGVPRAHPQMMNLVQRPFASQIPPQQVNQQAALSPGQQQSPTMFAPQGLQPQSPQFPQPRGEQVVCACMID